MRRTQYLVYLIGTLALAIGLIQACQVPLELLAVKSVEQIQAIPAPETTASTCQDYEAYIPDTLHPDHMPMRYVRVNMHFLNAVDGSKNYQGQEALEYGRKLIDEANGHLARNRQMWLPIGNQTPVLPIGFRYVLTTSAGYEEQQGIYCHYNDELYSFVDKGRNRNNYSRDAIRTYGIGLDSILNIFVMPHHPDSVRSETYAVTSAGIALGSAVKIAGVYETGKRPWAFKGLINHEVGHVMGLRHTWRSNDGCEDTPRHTNCWNRTDVPPCDTAASNNLMDYNANQHAWTPCQIGRVHRNMSRENSLPRKLLIQDWCRLDPEKTIVIRDSVIWKGAKDLVGDLIIGPGGQLDVRCRLSMPPGGTITVEPGGTLLLDNARLHNACGKAWNGIVVKKTPQAEGVVLRQGDTVLEDVATELDRP